MFRTEYTIPNFSREFCSVFVGTTNVGNEVVTHGWAKVIPKYFLAFITYAVFDMQ